MSSQKVVGPLILSNFDYLSKVVSTKSDKKLRKLIEDASPEVLLAIVEISLNVLKNKFQLKAHQVTKLKPFAENIRKISRARTPQTARKIIQTGEGLQSLVPLIVPILLEAAKILKNV